MKNLKILFYFINLVGILLFGSFSNIAFAAANVDQAQMTDLSKAIVVHKSNPIFLIKLPKANSDTVWLLKDIDHNLITPLKRIVHYDNIKHKGVISGYEEWSFVINSNAFKVPYKTNLTLIYASPANLQNLQGSVVTIIILP